MNIYTTPNLLLITNKLFPCLVVIKSFILWQSETPSTSGYCTTSRMQYSLVFLHSEYRTLQFPHMYTYKGLWVSSSLLHTPTNIMQYNSLHGKSRQSHRVFFPSYFTLKQSLEVSVRIIHLQDMVRGYNLYPTNHIACTIDHWKNTCIKKFMKNNFIAALKSIKFDT